MASAEQELESFSQFVRSRAGTGESVPSLDELFDLWRHENPSAEAYAEDVAAIAASIEDFKRGERGRLADEHTAELRRKYGFAE